MQNENSSRILFLRNILTVQLTRCIYKLQSGNFWKPLASGLFSRRRRTWMVRLFRFFWLIRVFAIVNHSNRAKKRYSHHYFSDKTLFRIQTSKTLSPDIFNFLRTLQWKSEEFLGVSTWGWRKVQYQCSIDKKSSIINGKTGWQKFFNNLEIMMIITIICPLFLSQTWVLLSKKMLPDMSWLLLVA